LPGGHGFAGHFHIRINLLLIIFAAHFILSTAENPQAMAYFIAVVSTTS
jgi:hypothetical protein